MSISTTVTIDYDGPMQANHRRMLGERDAMRRLAAILELYADDTHFADSTPFD